MSCQFISRDKKTERYQVGNGKSGLWLDSLLQTGNIAFVFPILRFNRKVSPNCVFEGRKFALNDFRAIKNQVEKATINDAVLTVCGGALSRYLISKGELPGEPLVAMAPINLRPGEDALDSGNQITAIIANLHTDISDPIKRMTVVRDTIRKSKGKDHFIVMNKLDPAPYFFIKGSTGRAAATKCHTSGHPAGGQIPA